MFSNPPQLMPHSPYFIYLPDVENWLDDVFKAKSSEVLVPSRVIHVQLFANPWALAYLALLSMESSRQEYWNGLPCPPPADLPNPEIKPVSLASPALADRLFFVTSAAWKAPQVFRIVSMIHGKPNSLTVRK